MGKKQEINILHISDLHCGIERTFEYEEDYSRRKVALEKFFEDFKSQIPKEWMPDVIVISGDLGWMGKKGDYIECESTHEYTSYTSKKFIEELLNVTSLKSGVLICCPGNHDKYQADGYLTIGRDGSTQNAAKNFRREVIKGLLPSFSNYIDLLTQCKVVQLNNKPLNYDKYTKKELENLKYLYGYRVLNVGQEEVLFIVMNSAWACNHKEGDLGKLRIGYEQARDVIRHIEEDVREGKIGEDILTVVLFHHPIRWLETTEVHTDAGMATLTVFGHFKASKNIVFLNGHEHLDVGELTSKYITNTSGTVSSTDTKKCNCSILKLYRDEDGFYHRLKGIYELFDDECGEPVGWKWKIELDEDGNIRDLPLRAENYINVLEKDKERLEKRNEELISQLKRKKMSEEEQKEIHALIVAIEDLSGLIDHISDEETVNIVSSFVIELTEIDIQEMCIEDAKKFRKSIDRIKKNVASYDFLKECLKEGKIDKNYFVELAKDLIRRIQEEVEKAQIKEVRNEKTLILQKKSDFGNNGLEGEK